MAGYFIYTLDGDAFGALTSSPTDEQAMAIAEYLCDGYSEELSDSQTWPQDFDSLVPKVKDLLASSDWYADLSDEDSTIIDEIVYAILDEDVENKLAIGFECAGDESVYWDCAELAAAQGATMMEEPLFGSSGFRYSGNLKGEFGYCRNYSIYTPDQVSELLDQLRKVESHFDSLPDDGEDGIRGQFFRELLAPVKNAAEKNRYVFVQTDT